MFVKHSTHRQVFFIAVLVGQEQLHRLHVLFTDGVQESITNLHLVAQQQLHHLYVLILDGDEQGSPAQGIHAVDVDVKVDLRLLQEVSGCGDVPSLHGKEELLLVVVQVSLFPDHPHAQGVTLADVYPQLIHQLLGVPLDLFVLSVHLVHLAVLTGTYKVPQRQNIIPTS